MADGDSIFEFRFLFAESVEVDDDTVRSTDFILTTIAFANVSVIIPSDIAKFFF